MALMNTYPPGTFCWVDLVASDLDRAKRFYTELFGWSATDAPAGDAASYTMLYKDGKSVGAMYRMNPELRNAAVPSHWQSYISVSNVDASVAKAEGLGAKLLSPATDVMDAGRMAVVQDPAGARFVLWEPKAKQGAELVNEPGSWCWNELHTTDIKTAERFYDDLFGWKAKHGQGAAVDVYVEFRNGPRGAGGMLEIQPSWGDVPPNWAVYFAVADLDAAMAKVKDLGGETPMPPLEIPKVGRFAMVHDDSGAPFALIQVAEGAIEPPAE